ncbi:hypothetical protein [Nocardiopsis alba]|uniref:hypothetical protein n=1 Tax=Nocardiopsis alba TaxID=53437 RepID=UPI003D7360D0
MAVTVITWAGAVALAALAAFLVFMLVFVVAAGIAGVREARRKRRETDAARDLLVRAFTGSASSRTRRRG